jgi:hypothetical protein
VRHRVRVDSYRRRFLLQKIVVIFPAFAGLRGLPREPRNARSSRRCAPSGVSRSQTGDAAEQAGKLASARRRAGAGTCRASFQSRRRPRSQLRLVLLARCSAAAAADLPPFRRS